MSVSDDTYYHVQDAIRQAAYDTDRTLRDALREQRYEFDQALRDRDVKIAELETRVYKLEHHSHATHTGAIRS